MLESMRFYQLAPFFDNSSKFFFSTSTSSFNTTPLTPFSLSQLLSINSIGYPEFRPFNCPSLAISISFLLHKTMS